MLLIPPDAFLAFATALVSDESVSTRDLTGSFDEIAFACLGSAVGVAAQLLVDVSTAFDELPERDSFDKVYCDLFRDYPRQLELDRMTLAEWARTTAEKLQLLAQVVSLLDQLRPAFAFADDAATAAAATAVEGDHAASEILKAVLAAVERRDGEGAKLALQDAEEIGGPDGEAYPALMTLVEAAAAKAGMSFLAEDAATRRAVFLACQGHPTR